MLARMGDRGKRGQEDIARDDYPGGGFLGSCRDAGGEIRLHGVLLGQDWRPRTASSCQTRALLSEHISPIQYDEG